MVVEGRASEYAIASGGHVYNVQYGKPLRVGRDPACEICLDSPALSRMHAWFWLERNEVWVEDLDSRNGVFVKGVRIRGRTKLDLGDHIVVGDRTLTLMVSELERSDTQPTAVPEVNRATRATEQGRSVFDVFIEAARSALDRNRPAHAAKAVENIFGALEASEPATPIDPRMLDVLTAVVADLAIATQNATWVELLIASRHAAKRPLDPLGVTDLARAIAALPSVDGSARQAYVAWRRESSPDAGEQMALELLAAARGR